MTDVPPFTFGIPLIARASCDNWALVEALLDLTLASLRAQTQQDFAIVLAGHDRPSVATRLDFIAADWPAEPVRSDNLDSGRKKYAISQHVLRRGGGLLMFLDADDWVDTRLVETARREIGADQVGGLIEKGFATDLRSLRTVAIPHAAVFDGGFHKICGSSTVAQLKAGHADPLQRDPTTVLHEHYRWEDVAAAHGVDIARLSVAGNYLVNTSANHSERHGPFAEWRRRFIADLNEAGGKVDQAFSERFGIDLDKIGKLRRRFYPTVDARAD